QREPVVARDASRLVRQPGPVQRRVEEVSRPVAGEDPSGPVPTVRRRSEADDRQTRLRIAPPRQRPRPVGPLAEGPALHPRHLLAPAHQPRAGDARGDAALESRERREGRGDARGVADPARGRNRGGTGTPSHAPAPPGSAAQGAIAIWMTRSASIALANARRAVASSRCECPGLLLHLPRSAGASRRTASTPAVVARPAERSGNEPLARPEPDSDECVTSAPSQPSRVRGRRPTERK